MLNNITIFLLLACVNSIDLKHFLLIQALISTPIGRVFIFVCLHFLGLQFTFLFSPVFNSYGNVECMFFSENILVKIYLFLRYFPEAHFETYILNLIRDPENLSKSKHFVNKMIYEMNRTFFEQSRTLDSFQIIFFHLKNPKNSDNFR